MARGNTAWPSNNNGVTWRRAKDCCRCLCLWRWQQRGRRRSISWSLTSFSFCFDHTISLLSKEIVGSSGGGRWPLSRAAADFDITCHIMVMDFFMSRLSAARAYLWCRREVTSQPQHDRDRRNTTEGRRGNLTRGWENRTSDIRRRKTAGS